MAHAGALLENLDARTRAENADREASEADTAPLLELRGVTVPRAEGEAVSAPVSFALDAAEGFAVVGAPGIGKTALARVISGALPVASGEMMLGGSYLAPGFALRTPAERRAVQLIPRDPARALNPGLTIRSQLRRALRRAHPELGPQAVTTRVKTLLELVHLPTRVLDEWPKTLDASASLRAALARVLAQDPQVVLCDEPVELLPESERHEALETLNEMRERGTALILVTNDSLAVRLTCERMLHLHEHRDHSLGAASFLPRDPGVCPVLPVPAA